MNEYQKCESIGRGKLKADYDNSPVPIDYIFTLNDFDPIDSFCTAHTLPYPQTFANEVKNRDIFSTLYADEGYILELFKYNALMNAYLLSGYTPEYINYFIDCRIVWNILSLGDITNRIIEKPCTKTTATNYGDRVMKKVILLKPNEGKIRWNNGYGKIKC